MFTCISRLGKLTINKGMAVRLVKIWNMIEQEVASYKIKPEGVIQWGNYYHYAPKFSWLCVSVNIEFYLTFYQHKLPWPWI